MSLLPPSTNDDYQGSVAAAWFLVLVGALTLAPGLIHFFLPDGGAGTIAGIDLSQRGQTIVAIFAWFGALQIPHGIAELAVGLRYRTLVPLFLLLVILERALMALDGWVLKGAVSGHHPPEHYASLVGVSLALVFLVLSLRRRG